MKKSGEKKLFFARRFSTIFKQKCSYLRPLLSITFPKGSKSLKILDIRLREVGAKRPFNDTSKVNRHTDGQTDGHTDRRTNRLIESIGPEGRCFEKKFYPGVVTLKSLCKISHFFGYSWVFRVYFNLNF